MVDLQNYVARQAERVTIPGAQPYFLPGHTGTAFLALHGWGATAESVRFLANGIASAGHAVLAPTLPGHGTSAEDMRQNGPTEWADCAREALDILRAHHDTVYLLGISMGGALAIQLAGLMPDAIAGLVTVNAPVFMGRPDFAREVLSAPMDATMRGWEVPAFKGPVVPEITYPARYKKSGVDLHAMCALAREILPAVTSPILVFQSVIDMVVPKDSAQVILDTCGSADKSVVWLENSYHVSQLDLDRDLIVAGALAFVQARSSA